MNKYFKDMERKIDEYHEREVLLNKKKEDLFKQGDVPREAYDAWYKEKESLEFPFPTGAVKAYEAYKNIKKYDTVVMMRFLWDEEVKDFTDTLRDAGIKEFVVTDSSTGLMDNIHGFVNAGWKLVGICNVNEKSFGRTTREVHGIKFAF